ncbi:MAG: hypothetical protein IPM50_01950 [Acidobacteriota bacterium]|nr:MAG: hypothetical protein IPM50_01950 [Acidobacteriota bacterium]
MRELVAELDASLLREHGNDAAFHDELTEMQRDLGIMHGDRPIAPFLRPYFLEASRYVEIQKAARSVFGAFNRMTEAALADPEILAELGLTEDEEKWARLHPGYEAVSVNSRLDTFLSADGFAFLEYNAENPAGIGDQRSLAKLVRSISTVERFLSEVPHYFPDPLESLSTAVESAYREFGGQESSPTVAIVDWEGVDTEAEFHLLAAHFESKGMSAFICDPREMDYSDEVLSARGRTVDVFFKRIIIHEFLEKFRDGHALFDALNSGSVCMINSFRSKIPHKKSGFAILTDDRFAHLFTSEQRETIAKHIPWTRRLADVSTTYRGGRVALLDLIRGYRERFILKPNDDYGGHGISFGWESDAAEWDTAIESALNDHFIVQERVAVERTDIPIYADGTAAIESLNVDLDPYLFNGDVDGAMVRLGGGSLVNITQGGMEAALCILEDF